MLENEAEALRRLRHGHYELLGRIMDLYGKAVRNYVRRVARDEAQVEDLTHRAFTEFFVFVSHQEEVTRECTSIEHLLYTIAWHLFVNDARRDARDVRLVTDMELLPSPDPPRSDQVVLTKEAEEQVRAEIAKLPPKCQLPATLVFLHNHPVTEAARLTRTNPKTFRSRFERARELLRVALRPYWKGIAK